MMTLYVDTFLISFKTKRVQSQILIFRKNAAIYYFMYFLYIFFMKMAAFLNFLSPCDLIISKTASRNNLYCMHFNGLAAIERRQEGELFEKNKMQMSKRPGPVVLISLYQLKSWMLRSIWIVIRKPHIISVSINPCLPV